MPNAKPTLSTMTREELQSALEPEPERKQTEWRIVCARCKMLTTVKRKSAIYCSDACRYNAYQERYRVAAIQSEMRARDLKIECERLEATIAHLEATLAKLGHE